MSHPSVQVQEIRADVYASNKENWIPLRPAKASGCGGSGRDAVRVPHSSPGRDMLCTGCYKGAGNTPVLWLLLSTAHTAPALCLQHSLPHHELGAGKILGVDKTQKVDPN